MDQVKRTIATYDHIAADYARTWQDRGILRAQLEQFASLLWPGSLVLDVGCGPGFDTAILREAGLQVVGLDGSWGMLQAGRQNFNVRGDFVQADIRHLPFAPRIHGLWLCASLLHLPRQDVGPALAGLARVLLPDGLLYLAVKQGQGEGWTETSYGHAAPRFFTYWQPATLDPLLPAAGFTIIDGWTDNNSNEPWLVRFARKI